MVTMKVLLLAGMLAAFVTLVKSQNCSFPGQVTFYIIIKLLIIYFICNLIRFLFSLFARMEIAFHQLGFVMEPTTVEMELTSFPTSFPTNVQTVIQMNLN